MPQRDRKKAKKRKAQDDGGRLHRKRQHFTTRVQSALECVRPVQLNLQSRLTDILLQNTEVNGADTIVCFPNFLFRTSPVETVVLEKLGKSQLCGRAAEQRAFCPARNPDPGHPTSVSAADRAENVLAAKNALRAVDTRLTRLTPVAQFKKRFGPLYRRAASLVSNLRSGRPEDRAAAAAAAKAAKKAIQSAQLARSVVSSSLAEKLSALGFRLASQNCPAGRIVPSPNISETNFGGALLRLRLDRKTQDAAEQRAAFAPVVDDSDMEVETESDPIIADETDRLMLRALALTAANTRAILFTASDPASALAADPSDGNLQMRVDSPEARLIRGSTCLAATERETAGQLAAGALVKSAALDLQTFPVLEKQGSSRVENLCMICYGDLNGLVSGKVQMLLVAECSHGGHWDCLLRAFEQKPNCPYCRSDVQICTLKVGEGSGFVGTDMPLTFRIQTGRRGNHLRVLPKLSVECVWQRNTN